MNTRHFLVALVVLSFTSCQYHYRKFAAAAPAPGTPMHWPQSKFDEVRAFMYDFRADTFRSFLKDGKMHKGVMDPKGVKLTPEQVKRLVQVFSISQPKSARTPCFAPHHAFVFYSKGQPVAVFEMCFGCNQFQAQPNEGLPEYIDTQALWTLCIDLKLPLGKGNQFYTDAVAEYRKLHGQ